MYFRGLEVQNIGKLSVQGNLKNKNKNKEALVKANKTFVIFRKLNKWCAKLLPVNQYRAGHSQPSSKLR